jgi:hypothetical protein
MAARPQAWIDDNNADFGYPLVSVQRRHLWVHAPYKKSCAVCNDPVALRDVLTSMCGKSRSAGRSYPF